MKNLIKKYLDRLNNLKENRIDVVDIGSDAENEIYDKLIEVNAEFVRDLKVIEKTYTNPIERGSYNDAPEGLKEITLEEWQKGMFLYRLEKSDSKQVRGEQIFDLRLFDVPNFENKKLGYAIMNDWFDKESGMNRSKNIVRFCRYGSDADWSNFKNRFAAQFAGDNS
jgi:AAA15 family ATPase/GTPase